MPKDSARMDFGLPKVGLYALGIDQSGSASAPLHFFPQIPEGWSDINVAYTISMPGFILEETTLERGDEMLEIVYDSARLHVDFPNIDLLARTIGSEPGLSGEVFISVFLSRTDSSGLRVHAAKVLTLVGENFYNLN